MEHNKDKTPNKKPRGFVLEWISDNLRYILLFGCMALIVVIAVVVASVILGGSGQDQDGLSAVSTQSDQTSEDTEDGSDSLEASSESEETAEASEESVETDETSEESVETDEVEETSESSSDISDEGSQDQQSSDEGTSSGQPSGESTASGQSSGENASSEQSSDESTESEQSSSGSTDTGGGSSGTTQQTSVLSEASEAIVSTVTSYFNALASADADAVAAVMESLSDDNRQAISSGLSMGGYHNIVVYTYPGESDGEWVAFARYYYTYSGFTTAVPALTQFYLITGQDGAIRIASETTLEAKADYMASLLSLDDVVALISEVRAEYNAVITANPALAAYIESLS